MDNIERILKLENELENLKDDLESNESEQMELRSIARGLKEKIREVEDELEDLGKDYD
jgi:chromosome segregation ATPase